MNTAQQSALVCIRISQREEYRAALHDLIRDAISELNPQDARAVLKYSKQQIERALHGALTN